MIKIAQINSVCGHGSTGRTTRDLADRINMADMDCRIFYGVKDCNYENSYKFISFFGVKLHILQTRLLGKHAFYSRLATKRLVRKLKEYKPDAIRLDQVHGHYLNIPILFDYFSKSKIPVVWTMNDCWAVTGHCAHFEKVGCEKWKTGCFECPQLHEYPISLIFDRSKESWRDKNIYFNKPENITFVCPSKWIESVLRQS